jgi:formylglycine-generating enzyme required for sulfatase activity
MEMQLVEALTEVYDDPARADEPVTAITWYQAVGYAHWVRAARLACAWLSPPAYSPALRRWSDLSLLTGQNGILGVS